MDLHREAGEENQGVIVLWRMGAQCLMERNCWLHDVQTPAYLYSLHKDSTR